MKRGRHVRGGGGAPGVSRNDQLKFVPRGKFNE